MNNRQVAILSTLLTFAILPQLLVTDAHAKMLPLPDGDYNFGQSLRLIIMPAIVASAVLFMIALYTRQNQQLVAK